MIRLGKKRAKPRTPARCPICDVVKDAHGFRQSNRNKKLNAICWQCRKDDPKVESKFYGGKVKTRKQILKEYNYEKVYKQRLTQLGIHLTKIYPKEVSEVAGKADAKAFLEFPEAVATIIGKTYSVRGDDFKLTDDEAIARIRDLLNELDDKLIVKFKNKRLSKEF